MVMLYCHVSTTFNAVPSVGSVYVWQADQYNWVTASGWPPETYLEKKRIIQSKVQKIVSFLVLMTFTKPQIKQEFFPVRNKTGSHNGRVYPGFEGFLLWDSFVWQWSINGCLKIFQDGYRLISELNLILLTLRFSSDHTF